MRGFNPPTFALVFQDVPAIPATYLILNTVTGREYIGSTTNLYVRLKKHFGRLNSGTHSNRALQADFVKYGIGAFEVYLLKREKDTQLEVVLIKLSEDCYNETSRPGSPQCKYDHHDHLEMIRLRKAGWLYREVGEAFGASPEYVGQVVNRMPRSVKTMLELADKDGNVRRPKTLMEKVFPTPKLREELQSGSV